MLRTSKRGLTRPYSVISKLFGLGDFKKSNKGLFHKSKDALQLATIEYVSMNAHPKQTFASFMLDKSEFVMGHVLLASSQVFAPLLQSDIANARNTVQIAKSLLSSKETSSEDSQEKPKLHLAALEAILNGYVTKAAAVYETILSRDPTDLLALRCSYDTYLKLGDHRNVLDTVTRRMPYYSPQMAGYSLSISMQAYGVLLDGRMVEAQELTEKVLAMNGSDRWAFYTMLQIMEMRGNPNHNASFVSTNRDQIDHAGHLQTRVIFQWALYLFGLGKHDRVHSLIEHDILFGKEPSAEILTTATQLFWRLKLADQDVQSLEKRLKDAWKLIEAEQLQAKWHTLSPLAQIHCHSILSANSDWKDRSTYDYTNVYFLDRKALEKELNIPIVQFSYPHPSDASMVAHTVSSACDAFAHYNRGEFDDAVYKLLRVRGRYRILGGTRSELQLFDILLMDAASRGSDMHLARQLMHERISNKSQDAQEWKFACRVLESLGDSAGLRDAQGMSYTLGLGQRGSPL